MVGLEDGRVLWARGEPARAIRAARAVIDAVGGSAGGRTGSTGTTGIGIGIGIGIGMGGGGEAALLSDALQLAGEWGSRRRQSLPRSLRSEPERRTPPRRWSLHSFDTTTENARG